MLDKIVQFADRSHDIKKAIVETFRKLSLDLQCETKKCIINLT
jgi:hypothetical protein